MHQNLSWTKWKTPSLMPLCCRCLSVITLSYTLTGMWKYRSIPRVLLETTLNSLWLIKWKLSHCLSSMRLIKKFRFTFHQLKRSQFWFWREIQIFVTVIPKDKDPQITKCFRLSILYSIFSTSKITWIHQRKHATYFEKLPKQRSLIAVWYDHKLRTWPRHWRKPDLEICTIHSIFQDPSQIADLCNPIKYSYLPIHFDKSIGRALQCGYTG